jgi:hypothetical protein
MLAPPYVRSTKHWPALSNPDSVAGAIAPLESSVSGGSADPQR